MHWALRNRLHRLQTAGGNFVLLALDHPMTFGAIKGLDDLSQWVSFVDRTALSGFVINAGEICRLRGATSKGVIVQLMGLPSTHIKRKLRLGTVTQAVTIGADAIAVQVPLLETEELVQSFSEISDLILAANAVNVPCLMMLLGVRHDSRSEYNAADLLRIVAQLPVDLVKISLPSGRLSRAAKARLQSAIAAGPPVLLAGGELSASFHGTLRMARDLGFRGVCAGRNIFQQREPEKMVQEILEVFP